MRVLFLVHRIPYPPNKGDKIRSFAELRALSEFAEVDVFCFYDDRADLNASESLRQFCHEGYFEWLSPWAARLRAGAAVLAGRPFSLAFFRSAAMREQIARAIATRQYDCVLAFSSSMAQYAMQSGLPWVLDMVDVDSDKWTQYSNHENRLTRWLWRLEGRRLAAYERRIVAKAAHVILCTEREAGTLRDIAPGGNVSSVANSIDLQYYDPLTVAIRTDIQMRRPYIIFPGQMDYFPNVEAALRFYRYSLPVLRHRFPQVQFVIAGRSPAKALRRLQTDSAVCVTGTVVDMRPWLKGAAAAVIPVRIARGIQNKILECLAMGIPVVCGSRCAAALPAAVKDMLLIEDDPVAMAERLGEVIAAGGQQPIEYIHGVLEEHFGFRRLRESLHALLLDACCETPDRVAVGATGQGKSSVVTKKRIWPLQE